MQLIARIIFTLGFVCWHLLAIFFELLIIAEGNMVEPVEILLLAISFFNVGLGYFIVCNSTIYKQGPIQWHWSKLSLWILEGEHRWLRFITYPFVHILWPFLRWLFTPSKGLKVIAKILGVIGFMMIPIVLLPILLLAVMLYIFISIPVFLIFDSPSLANIAGWFAAACSIVYFFAYIWHNLYGESSYSSDTIGSADTHKPITYAPRQPSTGDIFYAALLANYIGSHFWGNNDS